ncbi:MAG: cyclic nucleotide-binding domain-containing protein [Deltaproteobacteria bacterium]|nr:cyclic nucleotide-binding domain-containing protein [Deltaproteobacteria bacterium]
MLTTVEKVLFLKSIDLFARIPGEDLAQISVITEEVTFEDGEAIFEEGELGDALFLVVSGKVKVHKGSREVARLGAGECFGEMAILDSAPRSASVSAIDDVDCLKIAREDFYDILGEKPEIAQGIIRVLTARLRRTLDDVAGSRAS